MTDLQNRERPVSADVTAPIHDVSVSDMPSREQPGDRVAAQRVATPAATPTTAEPVRDGRRRWLRPLLMGIVPLIVIAIVSYFWLTGGTSASTDNAYVQQDKVSVSAEIGGRIVEVAVRENQHVNAGDLLFRLDPEPYRIAVDQANAAIADAQANVVTLSTTADSTAADIATAQRAVSFARAAAAREHALMARGFNTRARVDAADSALNEAEGRLADARAATVRARAQLATGAIAPGRNPGVLAAEVRREQALFQLARTEIRAPMTGIVTQTDRLQVGSTLVAGLPAITVVADNRSWIEANFKETDLDRMRVGQRASVHFDAYPDMDMIGHVESIGAGTGSEFSVLPAQNATGNWVKVTQRVPVRIALDGRPSRPLLAGLSADVTVHFEDRRR
jgi:membrane fusion protein (multidrug efflux system)